MHDNKMKLLPDCTRSSSCKLPTVRSSSSISTTVRWKRTRKDIVKCINLLPSSDKLLKVSSSSAILLLFLLATYCSIWQFTIVSAEFSVPGLYARDHFITPVQGQEQFEELVVHSNETKITLVQFYMATCPDCQGFSPYFRRFVADIGPHWHSLMRILVVNCNDDLNINLCWRENPKLVVPLIRWYTLPELLRDAKRSSSSRGQLYQFPIDLLSVAHRDYVEKQRRDLISLRKATLRFMGSTLEQVRLSASKGNQNSLSLYQKLPVDSWHHFNPLGRPLTSDEYVGRQQFSTHLRERVRDCVHLSGLSGNSSKSLINFVLFEQKNSYVGRTLVADWSNHTCRSSRVPFMIHYSNEWPLNSPMISFLDSPKLFTISLPVQQLISNNQTSTLEITNELKPVERSDLLNLMMRRKRQVNGQQANKRSYDGHLGRRNSLESYYGKRRLSGYRSSPHTPSQYLKSEQQVNLRGIGGSTRVKRNEETATLSTPTSTASTNSNSMRSNFTNRLFEAENINWAPPGLHPNDEELRRIFNRDIAKLIFLDPTEQYQLPGLELEELGEIKSVRNMGNGTIVSPKDEDLSLVRLTDYYKLLDEIVHKNTLSKAQLDGYQLVSVTCLLRQLARHFPFQGAQTQHKSIARNYIELLQRELTLQLQKRLPLSQPFDTPSLLCSGPLKLSTSQQEKLSEFRIPSKELSRIQSELRSKHDIGLPSEQHFKWSYCAGSGQYLRGHTCSLWLLFHTMTVHEFLQASQYGKNNMNATNTSQSITTYQYDETPIEYKFIIPNLSSNSSSAAQDAALLRNNSSQRPCNPNNPEPALLNASSRELFAEAPQYALANIINFVRYFLSCTNCAAHFSCMVERSPPNFNDPQYPDDHLLWLWEAHNRVNLRTKGTHSEDPLHPKHVFPVYEACPTCYLEKPIQSEPQDFDSLRFNRKGLVEFLVGRYRRRAILNNKIRIEDLYRKPVSI